MNRKEIESEIEISKENLRSLRDQITALDDRRTKFEDSADLALIRGQINDLEGRIQDVEFRKKTWETELAKLKISSQRSHSYLM